MIETTQDKRYSLGTNCYIFSFLVAAALALGSSIAGASGAIAADEKIANPLKNAGSWEDIRGDIVGELSMEDGSAVFNIEAPIRAEDAAIVPIRIVKKPNSAAIDELKVVVDENPAPLVADFKFGKAMDPLDMEMRIRVNQYSNVRFIAAIEGKQFMDGRFVKASGGCSAPASKDASLAEKDMGKMRLKQFSDNQAAKQSVPRRNAQLMIRHPNYSGLQRDQITQLFVPAHFIDHIEVKQGEETLFVMDGGISISENPVFRFAYSDNGVEKIDVLATDTEGNRFEASFDKHTLN